MATETGVAALLVLHLAVRDGIGVELWRRAVLFTVLKGLTHVCAVVVGVDCDSNGKA